MGFSGAMSSSASGSELKKTGEKTEFSKDLEFQRALFKLPPGNGLVWKKWPSFPAKSQIEAA